MFSPVQVTVFGPAPRMHYLSITPDNIVRIYPVTDMATRRPLVCLMACTVFSIDHLCVCVCVCVCVHVLVVTKHACFDKVTVMHTEYVIIPCSA